MDVNTIVPMVIQGIIYILGAGGLVAIVKAILDYRNGKDTKELASDEALVKRLEKHIREQDKRIKQLEAQRDADTIWLHSLIMEMGKHGVDLPLRPAPPDDK